MNRGHSPQIVLSKVLDIPLLFLCSPSTQYLLPLLKTSWPSTATSEGLQKGEMTSGSMSSKNTMLGIQSAIVLYMYFVNFTCYPFAWMQTGPYPQFAVWNKDSPSEQFFRELQLGEGCEESDFQQHPFLKGNSLDAIQNLPKGMRLSPLHFTFRDNDFIINSCIGGCYFSCC